MNPYTHGILETTRLNIVAAADEHVTKSFSVTIPETSVEVPISVKVQADGEAV